MITKFLLRDRLGSGGKGQKSDGIGLKFLKITMKHEGMRSPERAHVFACKVGADTREDLVRELRLFSEQIAGHEVTACLRTGYAAEPLNMYEDRPPRPRQS